MCCEWITAIILLHVGLWTWTYVWALWKHYTTPQEDMDAEQQALVDMYLRGPKNNGW